jgi:hypothetical protein
MVSRNALTTRETNQIYLNGDLHVTLIIYWITIQQPYLSVCLFIYLWLYNPLSDIGRFFSFLILYTVGRTPWTGQQAVTRPLSTHRTTQTQNKRTQTSMPWLGFEPTISAFQREKTVHAIDGAALLSAWLQNIVNAIIVTRQLFPRTFN